jgi:hypothetical protein
VQLKLVLKLVTNCWLWRVTSSKLQPCVSMHSVGSEACVLLFWFDNLCSRSGLLCRLGINDAMLEKLEEEAEYAAAKAELEELRNSAMDRIDTYKRR